MTQNDLISLMFRASQMEVGVLLRVSDVGRALRAFARARESASMGDELVALPPVRFKELVGQPEGNLVILAGAARGSAGGSAGEASTPQQEEEFW